MSNITRHQVQSSQIASIGYDEATKTMEIEFKASRSHHPKEGEAKKANSVYRYDDVPKEAWDDFRGAKSIGQHFYKSVKGKFGHRKL